MNRLLVLISLVFLSGVPVFAAEVRSVYAQVAGESITMEQYHAYYAERMRQEFYHGKVPDAELVGFDDRVLQDLVDRVLLRQEALRRQLEVDKEAVQQEVAGIAARLGGELPQAVKELRYQALYDDALSKALKQNVEDAVAVPDLSVLKLYYEKHPEKFTRPEQLKISLILLKVMPYEQAPVWQAAYDRAEVLLQRLLEGDEGFAELARANSDHESSVNGGDLGFVHSGMLSSEVQEIVNALSVGGVVDKPVVLLQGVALLRLDERRLPELLEFDQVRERVEALILKEQREQAWGELLVRLRGEFPVEMAAQ